MIAAAVAGGAAAADGQANDAERLAGVDIEHTAGVVAADGHLRVDALIVRFLLMSISPVVSVIVCGVANTPAVSKVMVEPSQASAMICRRLPAPLSAVVVTRPEPHT